ncbi:glycoside hydrolase family 32 protein [Actinomyces sp. MRS3W]|uniref:glycoside hydrolase family 32 protein n=1 Tax=Actinomyces sp. MRS3W TaxID=2800796 RepID=UPI0028FD7F92|nr:glycoside hydrolase family 32 protein [Actinomyces sp. MRS3W]MDU0348643.1 glycoside hydrolase family 32 protein [Actinomyces sp. MRS3W]
MTTDAPTDAAPQPQPRSWAVPPNRRVECDPAEQAARAAADPARPRWHVTPPWGWLNDPNGLSVWPGPDGAPLVHLFYQHNSHAPVHERIEWGHQYSADLIHWHDLPIALRPGDDADSASAGPDADGCWSGIIVADEHVDASGKRVTVPTMIYSGASSRATQTCCLATAVPGDPLLTHWVKEAANPVIDAAPASTAGLVVPEMRDHSAWRENGRWYQVMGSGIPGAGRDGAQAGAALCFSSEDLRTWTYEGPLASGDGDVAGTGSVWECPELVRLGDSDILFVSAWHNSRTLRSMWMTGQRSGTRMELGLTGRSDLGENYFYAPQSVLLPDGRRVSIGWMQPNADREQRLAAGWAGSMCIPREVSLADDGTVRFAPIAEVETLRRDKLLDLTDGDASTGTSGNGATTGDGQQGAVLRAQLKGNSLDLVLTGTLTDGVVTLDLGVSDDGARRTRLQLVRRTPTGSAGQAAWTGWLRLDRSASAAPGAPWAGPDLRELAGPVPLGEDGAVHLRVLLDHSSLEVFVNGQPLSARLGVAPGDDGVVVDARALQSARLEAWTMADAYAERLDPAGV